MGKENAAIPDVALNTRLLRQIANCLGYLVIKADTLKELPNSELIPVLDRLGFDRNEIAGLLETTPATVSVRLSQLKAAKSQAARKDAVDRLPESGSKGGRR